MSQYLSSNLTGTEETEVFVFAASFAQQRLWFLNQLVPGNPFYNVPTALRLSGSLNFTALQQTFNEIVRRHETLRTTFVMAEGQLLQVIAPTLTIPLPVIDLRNFESQEREQQAQRLATVEAQHSFNLNTGPLLRLTLLQLDAAEYILLLNLHHIVADGWSIGVLIRELGALYKAFVENKPSPLPELTIQYADFAEWQREWLQQVGTNGCTPLETQLAYWKQQLDGVSLLNLATDKLRPAVSTYQGAKQFIELPQYLTHKLEQLSQQTGVTLFMTLLAAFGTLLYRYTQQEDIAVGTPIANRNRSEIEGLIGFFVNSLVLRTDFSGNPTFRELLQRVREVTLAAYNHQELPFEKLVEELQQQRDLSRHPLFGVVFSLQNTPIQALELPGLRLSQFDFDSKTAKLDLEFHLWQDLESLKGEVVYSTDLFDDITITRMLGHFQTLLESIVANSEQRLTDLPLLTANEQQQLLIEWNDTKREYAENKCFHELFAAQVEKTPDAIALVFEQKQLTYRELNTQANQLASYLQQLGVLPDSLVGICVERSLEMIVALLGIFKAGGAYLPLDPSYPQERLQFMLEDTKVSVLVTQQKFVELFGNAAISVVYLDRDREIMASQSQENPNSYVTSSNLAYVIYTSGSTGKPKGVLIEHRGLSNLIKAQIEVFNLQRSNRILQFASLSFDAAIFEIVMALGTGATLYLAKQESLLPGQSLIQLLRENAITHITLPPAVLVVLPTESLPALETIICAGESCSQEIVKRWWSPNRRFFNAYGPTEVTVWSTIAEINSICEKPPIGRPIANTQIYILDKHLQSVPIGIPGEIYIGGQGIARGYLNLDELTFEKFISNPFAKVEGSRLYRTGDLARYRPDGNIEFLSRIDNQVKIRGFRIELLEIESVLNQHESVAEAVVVAQEIVSGEKDLVAYIVPKLKQTEITNKLRIFIKDKLPEYMVPKIFVILDSLPLTPNGKVNRQELAELDISNSRSIDKIFIAPRNSTELKLAEIWAEVLKIERIGIYDNFFDLGGNSLLSVRLLEHIHQQFERDLPLSTLFLNPTIESLATSLSTKTDSLPWSPLAKIQPTGSNPPFFCVHPIFGVVFPYYELAHHLGNNQPFYGLQSIGIDGKNAPLTSIEDMASHYIKALRQVQPKGPYFLGGWSFGGFVAFEMAQQLLKSGDDVALVAMLDTLAPLPENIPSLGKSLKFLLTTVARDIWPFFLQYCCLIAAYIKTKINNLISQIFNKFNEASETNLLSHILLKQGSRIKLISERKNLGLLNELAIIPILRTFYANSQAVINYIPQVYPKQITLFKTSKTSRMAEKDLSMGWDKLAVEKTEIHTIPGNHLTILRKPNIQVLAAKLKACIEKRI
ncbi:MAG: non-ribosomal peptide synthetase [Aulosira sp. ZfuVER01]|nr:amino acid adenylation domain-containing protein [Aulosira sp. ZfuVER01]MDZ7997672.1 amino acid adenylation domain-containing protein [Aulosira sp. DedVER01a]MDZ8055345.1 amino acid adenylation domain-containing protein [Aulosira sp. ZfuCHP01]